MLLKQQFKTRSGAEKRAAFERAHCDGRYNYHVVLCRNGEPCSDRPEVHELIRTGGMAYTYRLEKVRR